MFPNYEWLPWKFNKVSPNFWDVPQNQRKFLDWFAKELNIKEMSDWYNVSVQVFYFQCFSNIFPRILLMLGMDI